MDKLKTGIVGVGKVAHLHAVSLVNLYESEFVAVCGRNKERTESFAGKYSVKAYTDVGEMVQKEKLDVVLICTPHPAHRDPAVAALGAGAHVLVEKPLASSLEDSDAMIAAARQAGKTLGVICQRRFYKPSLRIKEALDAGKIGKPVFGTINMLGWRDEAYYQSDPWRGSWEGEGGGVLVNQAPHQLDLLQWYMGEIDEVYGIWSNLNHPYVPVDDTAVAILKFKNGGIGNIVVSNSQKPGIFGKVHIHGETGASLGVQTDGGAMFIAGMSSILEPPVNDLWTIPGEEKMLQVWIKEDSVYFNSHKDPSQFYIQEQIGDFLRSVLEGRRPMVTGEDGRITVEIFTAIYRSTRDGKAIKFPLSPETGRNDYDGRLNR